ncbi:hypothetical protein HYU89_01485 [Candidatus Collierbacteria bacterium]|nr:hypothetical protein [Candidatus Collierbacteria bacterium]
MNIPKITKSFLKAGRPYIFIQANSRARVIDLVEFLRIGSIAIHRQLKKLVTAGILIKVGTAPKVFYVLTEDSGGPDEASKTNKREV